MAKKYKTVVFLLILLFICGINFAESEPLNCKEVQCPPPEIIENCPADSILVDKYDFITTLLTTIATTTTTTTTTIPSPTTTTIKITTPEIISVKLNEILYEDANSNETDSIEMTDDSITSEYSTTSNILFTNNTVNNSVNTDNLKTDTANFVQSSVSSIETDSILPSINSTDSITTNNTNNKTTKKPRKHRKKITKGRKKNESTTEQINVPTTEESISNQSSSNHVLEKRSLRSYQRESIKIVPGGYIGYEPQVLHYRQHNHHKWKRNAVLPESTKLPTIYHRQMCCPKKECSCRENGCVKPMCVSADDILVEVKSGSNIPGKCCPQYECIHSEPECLDDAGVGKPYWLSKCEKCQCVRGTKFCYDGCPPPIKLRNCYSNALKQSFPHGKKWKEDDCAICECVDGHMDCLTTFCKNPNCKKEIKIPGQCCRVCEENILTTIITTILPTTTTPYTTISEPNYLPESKSINLTPILTTWQSPTSESDSIYHVFSSNYFIIILLSVIVVVVIAGSLIAGYVYKKCIQRVYEPVKKSDSTNSSQTQEKPNGLKASNSQ